MQKYQKLERNLENRDKLTFLESDTWTCCSFYFNLS